MSKESHESKLTTSFSRLHKDQYGGQGDETVRMVAFGDPEKYGTHRGEGRKVSQRAEKEWRKRYPGYDAPGYVHKPTKVK